MKILYIDIPLDPPGGGQISLLTLLKNIDNDKYSFKVFINRECLFGEMLRKNKIDIKVVPIKSLFMEIKSYSPDIVHINSACTRYTFFSALFSKILGLKVVWHNRVIESSLLREVIISLLVDKILVVSNAVAQKFFFAKRKVVVIYNSVDFRCINFTENTKLKRKLNIPQNYKVIGIFSRLEKWKGHEWFFRAFSKLDLSQFFLLIGGEGSERKKLGKLSKELGISKNVMFLGYVKNIYDYIKICDIIINPSIEPEPFGRIIIEAMALGKVVIAAKGGGTEEIIKSGINGIVIGNDEHEFVKTVNQLVNNKEFYAIISKNALLRSRDFDIEYQMNKIYQVYGELV